MGRELCQGPGSLKILDGKDVMFFKLLGIPFAANSSARKCPMPPGVQLMSLVRWRGPDEPAR